MANKKPAVKAVETKAVTTETSIAERFLAKEVKAVNELGVNGKRAVHLEAVRAQVREIRKGDK